MSHKLLFVIMSAETEKASLGHQISARVEVALVMATVTLSFIGENRPHLCVVVSADRMASNYCSVIGVSQLRRLPRNYLR